MKKTYNIILIDDHKIFREALKFVLAQSENFNVVAEASNGKEFLDILDTCNPDVALMDITMPVLNGIDATKEGLKKCPGLKIIALSMHNEETYYYKMLEAGAHGFVLKDSGGEELAQAIQMVIGGENYFSNQILCKIIKDFLNKSETQHTASKEVIKLSKRENEVLKLICNGYSNSEIAEELGISRRTIEGHRSSLLNKTGAKNSIHLVLYAKKNKDLLE